MATDEDAARDPLEDEMLPDEREVIAERAGLLEDEASQLTVDEVAEELGIDLE